VISKSSAKIEKDIAQKIALTYKNRVLAEVNFILDNFPSYEAKALEHRINVMEVLMAAGFDDDAELNASKKQLLSRLDLQSIEHLSPVELDTLEKSSGQHWEVSRFIKGVFQTLRSQLKNRTPNNQAQRINNNDKVAKYSFLLGHSVGCLFF